jgi:hypothetical protein
MFEGGVGGWRAKDPREFPKKNTKKNTELFDDPTARFTVLAPTNEAWLKRLPSLTAGANLTAAQLLSDGRARVLEQVLNYHVIPGMSVIDSLEKLALRGRLPTNAASCSTSKEIQVAAEQPVGPDAGQVTLASSLGGTARTAGPPSAVTGGSSIIPIDDLLLPSTVVIPTVDALAGPSSLNTSALPASTLASLQAALDGREPLPLTDDVGLSARDRAAQGSTAVPLPAVRGGGDGGTVPDQPAPARRTVTVPTLPPDDGAEREAWVLGDQAPLPQQASKPPVARP